MTFDEFQDLLDQADLVPVQDIQAQHTAALRHIVLDILGFPEMPKEYEFEFRPCWPGSYRAPHQCALCGTVFTGHKYVLRTERVRIICGDLEACDNRREASEYRRAVQ